MPDLSRVVVHRSRSWWIGVLLLLLAGAAIGGLGEAEREAQVTDSLPAGLDSTRVAELEQELPDSGGSSAVVLYTVEEAQLDGATLEVLNDRFASAVSSVAPVAVTGTEATEGGTRQEGPAGPGGRPGLLVSEDGTAAIGVVPVEADGAVETAEVIEGLRSSVRADLPDGVTAQVTGPAAVQADLAAVFDGADIRLLAATATVVALLLLITYRSPFLWLVPLVVVGVADRLAAVTATHGLRLAGVPWDESTVGILSVLVFGAGTDYALLLISRYRDELRLEENRYVAMARALRLTTEAIVASSTTVILGLLTLLLSLIPTTRGLGLACAIGVAVAACFALVVLPSVLVLFGRWVFWPLVPRVGQTPLAQSERSLWHRVGVRVSRRPTAFIVVAVLVLAGLASGLTQVRSGLSQADQFLETPGAITAAERLGESFPAGRSDPTVVLTRGEAEAVAAEAAEVAGVDSAVPAVGGDDLARIDVVLVAPAGSDEARAAVEDLRAALAGSDVLGADTWVGGTEATALDASEATARDRLVIIPLILGLVLVALFVLLRSVVAPLFLVGTVVATYFASLGASWWLFTGVFGFERLDDGVPLLAFLFLVALGVDYNIFLVSRAAEESRLHGTHQGMLRALTATGGVITSAGILLAAVFAVLGVLPLVVLAQLGVIICIGVLIDTLLVRTVLVPAIAWRTGEAFWWPRRVTDPVSTPRERASLAVG